MAAIAPESRGCGSQAVVNCEFISQIARNVVKVIGYDQEGFSYHGTEIEILLHEVAVGVKVFAGTVGERRQCIADVVIR